MTRRHDHAETVTLEAELVIARAERDRSNKSLKALVEYVERVGGFMRDKDQATLWEARACLVESE